MYLPRIVEHLHAQAQQRQLDLEGVQLSRGGVPGQCERRALRPRNRPHCRVAKKNGAFSCTITHLRHHQRAVPTAGSYNRQTQVKVKHVDGKRPPRTNCVPLRYTRTTKKSVTAHDWGVGHHLAGCRGLSL